MYILQKNKINNKVYIGQHRKECYDETYYGSGKLIKEAISENGIDSFSNEIILECENQEEMNENEKLYIKQYNSLYQNGLGYNISSGGNGGDILKDCSDEIKKKRLMSYRRQNSGENNPNFGNGYKTSGDRNPAKREDVRKKLSEKLSGKNNPMYGKHPTFKDRRYKLICKNVVLNF